MKTTYSTFVVVCLALWISVGINVYNLVKSKEVKQTKQTKHNEIHHLDISVNLTAAICYSAILGVWNYSQDLNGTITNVRYLDWAITVPLLLMVILRLGNAHDNWRTAPILMSSFLMIASGWLADSQMNGWFFVGFLFYALTFGFLHQSLFQKERCNDGDDPDKKKKHHKRMKLLYGATSLVWGFYGVAFLFPSTIRNISYNALDLISKVGFTIVVVTAFKS